jgi:molybdopterin molybdotransferase
MPFYHARRSPPRRQNEFVLTPLTQLTTVAQAREIVMQAAQRLALEQVPVDLALGRILAADVIAETDVPAFASSAMDGYAVRTGAAGRTLEVVGESRAGAPSERTVAEHEAIRISTGAAVPTGADAVVRQEDTQRDHDRVVLGVRTGALDNIRAPGQEVRAGAVVLCAGTPLGPAELGAAAIAGAGVLHVSRSPRVAVLCTGDELRAPGESLGAGQIHNSNAPMLSGLAARSGAMVRDALRVADDRASTEAALATALERADVVVISGGISVGPHDHVKAALAALGVQELFCGVALQPGKPTWFGARRRVLVFGLPGNPVSAFVTFILFACPALAALQGSAERSGSRIEAELGTPVRRHPHRERALTARVVSEAGALRAWPNCPQGSHVITSLLGADALALVPAGDGELPAGAPVTLELLPAAAYGPLRRAETVRIPP